MVWIRRGHRGKLLYVFKRNLADVFNRTEIFMPLYLPSTRYHHFKFRLPLQKIFDIGWWQSVLFWTSTQKISAAKIRSDLEKPNSTNADYEREKFLCRQRTQIALHVKIPLPRPFTQLSLGLLLALSGIMTSGNSIWKRVTTINHLLGIPIRGELDCFFYRWKIYGKRQLDNTVRIWDVETRQELCYARNMANRLGGESHPSGLFDASPAPWTFIYFSTEKKPSAWTINVFMNPIFEESPWRKVYELCRVWRKLISIHPSVPRSIHWTPSWL